MGRNPSAGKAIKSINTTVEAKSTVKAEELKRPEVVEIQPIERKPKKDSRITNKFGGK